MGNYHLFFTEFIKKISIRKHYSKICFSFLLIAWFFFYFNSGTEAQKLTIYGIKKKTIVIDPGHGGDDHGSVGSSGIFEKEIALLFAETIQKRLKKKYNIVLTRTDDYKVNIPERGSIANNEKADLFISLHTGGSYLHKAGGFSLFYYSKPRHALQLKNSASVNAPQNNEENSLWDDIQYKHIQSSRLFINILKKRAVRHPFFKTVETEKSPLIVLSGINAPAVFIELGYLTNPGNEKNLVDINIQKEFADIIADSIDTFFRK